VSISDFSLFFGYIYKYLFFDGLAKQYVFRCEVSHKINNMKMKYNHVYQFKIWSGYHLHEFEVVNPSTGLKQIIGTPDDDYGRSVLLDKRQKIADYFSMANESAYYVYDFGDTWEHEILLEKILPREKGVKYPICLKGRRACPPEDSGGIWGYEELLEIIKDPQHEEYEEMLEWLGGEFDPEYFDVNAVNFRDPDKLLRMGFE
jgi:hypothetical protein